MIISNTTKKEIIGDKLKITTTMVAIHNLQEYLLEKQATLESVVASANTVFADLQEVSDIATEKASEVTKTKQDIPLSENTGTVAKPQI